MLSMPNQNAFSACRRQWHDACQTDLTWLNLVSSGCVLDGADGGSGVIVEGCSGVEDVVAGLDGDAAVAAQGLHEFPDRPAGLAFEPVADGEGGNHDGEVGLDGVAFVVVDRPGS